MTTKFPRLRLFMGISDEIEDATIAATSKALPCRQNIRQSDLKKIKYENDKSFDPQSNLKCGN